MYIICAKFCFKCSDTFCFFNVAHQKCFVSHLVIASVSLMQPITFALVYVGTTLKDLSDVTHGWNEISATHWVGIIHPFIVCVNSYTMLCRLF